MKKAIHCLVSGRVQGVCFRMCTREQADLLGLDGWVRNLVDGRVEVKAEGESGQLNQLRDWLHKGPPMARVTNLEISDIEPENFTGFNIR